MVYDTVAEWLRRLIRNHLDLFRVGSSPTGVDQYLFSYLPTSCKSQLVLPFFLTQYISVALFYISLVLR
jgi:hypothetical protein